jgi:hypothetical protein
MTLPFPIRALYCVLPAVWAGAIPGILLHWSLGLLSGAAVFAFCWIATAPRALRKRIEKWR